MLNWSAKDPDAILDYRWEPPLDEGDTLVSASIVRISGDVVISSQTVSGTDLQAVLTGGTVGNNLFRGVWSSVGGRSGDEYIAMDVVENAPIEIGAAYGTDAGFSAWLYQQGYKLPADALSPSVLRARGTAYIDGYEAHWTGSRTGGAMQDLGWPRTGASLNCTVAIASDVIPPAVVNAAYRAAWLEGQTPGILAGPVSTPGSRVKRQKVDSIEREFFDDGKATVGGGPSFIDSTIDTALQQFVCDATGGAFVWSLGS